MTQIWFIPVVWVACIIGVLTQFDIENDGLKVGIILKTPVNIADFSCEMIESKLH